MALPLPENGGHRLQAAPKDAMRSSPVSRRAEHAVGAPVPPPLPGAQVRRAYLPANVGGTTETAVFVLWDGSRFFVPSLKT